MWKRFQAGSRPCKPGAASEFTALGDFSFGSAHACCVEKPVTGWNAPLEIPLWVWEPSEDEISRGAKCTFGTRAPAVTASVTGTRWPWAGPVLSRYTQYELRLPVPCCGTYQFCSILEVGVGPPWIAAVGTEEGGVLVRCVLCREVLYWYTRVCSWIPCVLLAFLSKFCAGI